MLTVVQDQQQVPAAQRVFERRVKRLARLRTHPQGAGHLRGDEGGPAHVGQADQPGAVGETVGDIAAEPQGEARLADSAGAAQRQDADVSEQKR